MAKGTAIFRVTQAGTRRAAADMSEAARKMKSVVLQEMRALSPELVDVLKDYAPEDTGLLKEHLSVSIATGGRIRATVHSSVVDPESGYPYTGVTRFGHRGKIVPVSHPTLNFFRYGRWNIAQETAGHHPDRDWVEDARPALDRESQQIATRVGRTIYTRLLA